MRCLAYITHVMTAHAKTVALFLFLPMFQITAVTGQDFPAGDTVNIQGITVTAASSSRHTPFSISKIDSLTIALYANDDLGTLLQSASLLSVKRYGNHGLASVSLRGMSGSHTLVTWNGISVTAPATGMNDFAIIPAMAASSVEITPGGSDLQDIAGSIGGRIELLSEPATQNGTAASLILSAGSYDDYASSLILRTGNKSASANIFLWGSKAENDFVFINSDSPSGPEEGRRSNSAANSAGMVGDLFFHLRKSTLSAHLWYSDADRELPGPVTTVQQDFGEKQADRSVRSAVKYSLSSGKLTADVTAGESYEINSYMNESAGVKGDNRSVIYTLKGRLGYRINEKSEFILNTGDEYQVANSLSYDDTEIRNMLSASLTARYSPASWARLIVQARQIIVSGAPAKPEMTAGGSFLLTHDGRNIIKANFSRNLKIPSLNDLYWSPGGNSGLRPEISTGWEAAYSFASISSSGNSKSLDITFHSSSVSDLIQWIPGDSGFWYAENVRSVRVTGIEGRSAVAFPVDRGGVTVSLNYAYTRSVVGASGIPNDRSVGKQLIYTPLHHLNASTEVLWRFLRAGASAVFESTRYTASDNSEWLPSSLLADGFVGSSFIAGCTKITMDIKVKNIFNTPAESVRNYPLPLRTYTLRLILSISSKEKTRER